MRIDPSAAASATAEPEISAKNIEVAMLTSASAPRSEPSIAEESAIIVWDPVKNHYGALLFLYGTAVSSFVALLIATPLSIAIGLYLSELAPRALRGVVGSLVEMLAAIPCVVLGLWGILVLGPVITGQFGPWLNGAFGCCV